MAAGRILVIVPELDLRRSLEFVLEAEGYVVVSRPRLDLITPNDMDFDCTIVDHRALVGPRDRAIEFCSRAAPVVLLASIEMEWLAPYVACHVKKPMIGDAITAAVRAAIGHTPSVTTK